MTKEDREQLILYTNPNYWINLRGNKHPNTVLYQKKKFEYLIKNNKLSTRKDILIELLANKFAELIASDCISKFHYAEAA